jgi:hypothetical protein
MCDDLSTAVFCTESIECFPGIVSRVIIIITIIIIIIIITQSSLIVIWPETIKPFTYSVKSLWP